jgi:hypothetical protein
MFHSPEFMIQYRLYPLNARMTHELILTSVARGLEPEDSGFCPVASDQAIPKTFVDSLKRLSNYRHIVQPNRHTPVCYSHIIIENDTAPYHVLSRICDAGTDFQQQPNTLAHHVVVHYDEMNHEGPAWVLSLPEFHLSQWNSPCLRFPCGRPIPRLTVPPSLTRRQHIARKRRWCDPNKMLLTGDIADLDGLDYKRFVRTNDEQIAIAGQPTTPCQAWHDLTGDAGWGGILADTILSGQPTVIVFSPEQNLLPLFVEALALLPQEVLWRGTFSTYYSGLPEDIFCQWKGCAAGFPETKKLTQDSAALVIDLTKPLGTAPPGNFVEFARFGLDYLLPDKETVDTFFQSLLDNDTKEYDNGTPNLQTEQSAAKSKPGRRRAKSPLWQRLISLPKQLARKQFYILYSVIAVLVVILVLLLLDETLHLGIVKKHHRQETANGKQEPLTPLDSVENLPPLPKIEPVQSDVIPSKAPVLPVEPKSELDDDKPVAEDKPTQNEPVIPVTVEIPVPMVEQIIGQQTYVRPLSDGWMKYYDLQEQAPAIKLTVAESDKIKVIQESPQKVRIHITTSKEYRKIVSADKEVPQPIILEMTGEVNEKEICFTDLYEEQLATFRSKQKTLKERQEQLTAEITKIQADNMREPNPQNMNKIEPLKEEQSENENRLHELEDLLDEHKLEESYKEMKKAASPLHFEVFFGDAKVLTTTTVLSKTKE